MRQKSRRRRRALRRHLEQGKPPPYTIEYIESIANSRIGSLSVGICCRTAKFERKIRSRFEERNKKITKTQRSDQDVAEQQRDQG